MIRRLRIWYLRRKARWTDEPQELVFGRFPHNIIIHIYPDGTWKSHTNEQACMCDVLWMLDDLIARLER